MNLPSLHQILGFIFVICGVVGLAITSLPTLVGMGIMGRYVSLAALVGGGVFAYVSYQKEKKSSVGYQYKYDLFNIGTISGSAVALGGLIGLIVSFFWSNFQKTV